MAESIINSGINYLLDQSGVQQHFDENEVLRAAADRGQISNELYNKMGGFNFKQNVPFAGDVGTGLGSLAHNVAQSVLGNQPISEIPGDVFRNYMGAAAGLTKGEKDIYNNILSGGGGGVAGIPGALAFMQKRKAEGKAYSEKILKDFLEQQAQEEAARRAAIDRAQQKFYASDNPGRGPQNNPQGGLGRQDYSREPSSAFADLASELGI